MLPFMALTFRPISDSIFMSPLMVLPLVVSIFPVIVALHPDSKAFLPFSERSFRPAARRIFASGLMKRNIAIVRKISSSVRGLFCANGVPGIDMSALIGIERTFSSESESAMSILSSKVSPMPMIPPEQTQKPSSWAILIVSIFIS